MKFFVFVIFLLTLECCFVNCYRIDDESYRSNEIENASDLFKLLKSHEVSDDYYGGDLLDVIVVWKEEDKKEGKISEKVATRSKREAKKTQTQERST